MISRDVVGQGRSAEAFAWDEKRVLKLFCVEGPREGVRHESRISRPVHPTGLPTPAIYDGDSAGRLSDAADRVGIRYERIDGPSMLHDPGPHDPPRQEDAMHTSETR